MGLSLDYIYSHKFISNTGDCNSAPYISITDYAKPILLLNDYHFTNSLICPTLWLQKMLFLKGKEN